MNCHKKESTAISRRFLESLGFMQEMFMITIVTSYEV